MSYLGLNSLNPYSFSSVASYYRSSSDHPNDLLFPANFSFEPDLFSDIPGLIVPVLPPFNPNFTTSPADSLAQSFDAITLEPSAKKAKTGLEPSPTSISKFVLPANIEVTVCNDDISETSEVTSASFYFKVEAVELRTDPDTVAESTRYLLCKRARATVHFTIPVFESEIENAITGVPRNGPSTTSITKSTSRTIKKYYLPYINSTHLANWKGIHGPRNYRPAVEYIESPSAIYESESILDDSPTDDDSGEYMCSSSDSYTSTGKISFF
jgi:hypothetical protein